MGHILNFLHELKDYRKRSFVYLLITIVVSVIISFVTWWFQQQTISDLRMRLLTNQSNLQSQINSFKETTVSVPELQQVTLQILDRIETRLEAENLSYNFGEVDNESILDLCELSLDYDLQSMKVNYWQPFYADLSLEPVFVVFNYLQTNELEQCLVKNNLSLVVVDKSMSLLIPGCYFDSTIDENGEKNHCYKFIDQAFLN